MDTYFPLGSLRFGYVAEVNHMNSRSFPIKPTNAEPLIGFLRRQHFICVVTTHAGKMNLYLHSNVCCDYSLKCLVKN
jgi:hypothetical protein